MTLGANRGRHHSSLALGAESSRTPARAAALSPKLLSGLYTSTAPGLRVHECPDVAKPGADGRPIHPTETAADVQAAFVLEHLDAAAADGGVHLLIYPCPRDGGHLRQVDDLGTAAHRPVVSLIRPLKVRFHW